MTAYEVWRWNTMQGQHSFHIPIPWIFYYVFFFLNIFFLSFLLLLAFWLLLAIQNDKEHYIYTYRNAGFWQVMFASSFSCGRCRCCFAGGGGSSRAACLGGRVQRLPPTPSSFEIFDMKLYDIFGFVFVVSSCLLHCSSFVVAGGLLLIVILFATLFAIMSVILFFILIYFDILYDISFLLLHGFLHDVVSSCSLLFVVACLRFCCVWWTMSETIVQTATWKWLCLVDTVSQVFLFVCHPEPRNIDIWHMAAFQSCKT